MRSTVSCGAFSARFPVGLLRRAPRRLIDTPTLAPRRLSSPYVWSSSPWKSCATDMPSAARARPLPSRCTTASLISRSVPICASVSRIPRATRQRGRCRSPSVCRRAASSRGIAQLTRRSVPNRVSESCTSPSKRQDCSSTYGATVPPERSRRPVIRTPRSFSEATRPGTGPGPWSSSSATTAARTLRSWPQTRSACGSSRSAVRVLRSQTLPVRYASHMSRSGPVRSDGSPPGRASAMAAPSARPRGRSPRGPSRRYARTSRAAPPSCTRGRAARTCTLEGRCDIGKRPWPVSASDTDEQCREAV